MALILIAPKKQIFPNDNNVTMTMMYYRCDRYNFSVFNLIFFLLKAQNNRFEVCDTIRGQAYIVCRTDGFITK